MELQSEDDTDFANTLDNLIVMFENVVSKEVITVVLESCGGDLSLAADAIMEMTNDSDTPSVAAESSSNSNVHQSPQPESKLNVHQIDHIPLTQQSVTNITESFTIQKPAMSYSGASRSTGAVPKLLPKSSPRPNKVTAWPEQTKDIITYHNKGSRILIFMRGASGSGKSYLARQIIEMTVGSTYSAYNTHILSTDDFFMVRGHYQYDKSRLSYAHDWNHNRAAMAFKSGVSPVIIDNTNIEVWEMEPYLREGVKNGYIIKVVEPNTPWAKKAYQLIKKSTHNVPPNTIRRMLDNLQSGITGEQLIKHFGLSYPGNMVPPVIRIIPPYDPPEMNTKPLNTTKEGHSSSSGISDYKEKQLETVMASANSEIKKDTIDRSPRLITTVFESENENEDIGKHQRYLEIQKQLEEMEKVDQEWEHGESWVEAVQEKSVVTADDAVDPLPPRSHSEETTPRDNNSSLLFENMMPKYEDWTKISMFMPSWNDMSSNAPNLQEDINILKVTKSSSTCIEIGDTDLKNQKKVFKIITATPRDINYMYIPLEREKIPETRMLDKSTITNEFLLTEAYKCQNVEQHFVAFRKMFKKYSKDYLRYIFDNCCGDVNWAVENVMSDVNSKQLKVKEDDYVSEDEEEIKDQCNCLAAYGIIPDTNNVLVPTRTKIFTSENIPEKSNELVKVSNKKSKNTPSESSLQLKREIERNFVLSDNSYSPHILKIKKWRHGECLDENSELNIASEETNTDGRCLNYDFVNNFEQTKDIAASISDDEESNTSSAEDVERTINIHLGAEFIYQLDELFGRRGMTYPEKVVPRINIPISLLNEINAFWIESLMSQLDEQDKQNAKMLREDEEFARQLVMKENEMAQQGKTPAVPDFKEIMDMDFAISLYQKDLAEWRNKEPTDIAAKMSRDKLYNLFPDLPQDILSELLMAHDNDFLATVEGLLVSTGKVNVVEEQNGVNKFIMEKEMERQEKVLEEERKALTEIEWPLLPQGKKVEMSTVNEYREEAEKHLARRNLNYQKAQEYIRRGMTQVANYYSDIASFHKQKYEQANSLAAASLMQVHAHNSPDNATIDLHYLRVGEAKESLDLFVDTHIQKLRESAGKGINSHHTLFFITGRGLHSNGRPRVKPAVKKRLKERGLVCTERNPGLLTAKVCADDKLSYQVQVP